MFVLMPESVNLCEHEHVRDKLLREPQQKVEEGKIISLIWLAGASQQRNLSEGAVRSPLMNALMA
jgi:hypothetical protein